jgi:TrmH family RNA methyltransferase
LRYNRRDMAIEPLSPNNRRIRDAARLRQKKSRRASGRILVEGARLVADALHAGANVVELFCTAEFLASDTGTAFRRTFASPQPNHPGAESPGRPSSLSPQQAPGTTNTQSRESAENVENAERPSPTLVSDAAAEKLSDTRSPQGAFAVIDYQLPDLADVLPAADPATETRPPVPTGERLSALRAQTAHTTGALPARTSGGGDAPRREPLGNSGDDGEVGDGDPDSQVHGPCAAHCPDAGLGQGSGEGAGHSPAGASQGPRAPLVLVADAISDPGNLGTMIRSAAALGAAAVVATGDACDMLNPKVVRATMGALFRVAVAEHRSLDEVLDALRERGIAVIATIPRGGVPPWEIDLARPTALLVGSETGGLSPRVIDRSDARVTIPMHGGSESLNAATAAAALLSEAARQRRI